MSSSPRYGAAPLSCPNNDDDGDGHRGVSGEARELNCPTKWTLSCVIGVITESITRIKDINFYCALAILLTRATHGNYMQHNISLRNMEATFLLSLAGWPIWEEVASDRRTRSLNMLRGSTKFHYCLQHVDGGGSGSGSGIVGGVACRVCIGRVVSKTK